MPDHGSKVSANVVSDLRVLLRGSEALRSQEDRWIDLMPANFSVDDGGISYFDMSLFDPKIRGVGNTGASLRMHATLSSFVLPTSD